MAGFHLPGDPYFPDQRNGGWLGADPEEDNSVVLEEEDFEESFKEENEDEMQEDSDSEPEVYNPPQVVQNPNPRQDFQGPTPLWVVN